MFEFFIALFGSLYYGDKISAERAEVKKFDKASEDRFLWHDQRQQAWKQQVCDRVLEENLKNFIANPQNYDKVWEEVQEAYQQMPSYRSYTIILLHPYMVAQYYGRGKYTKRQCENIAEHERRRALNIMLARRGKVRSHDTQSNSAIELLNKGDGQQSKKVWNELLELWTYVRNELRHNGVDAKLIFKTGLTGPEHLQTAYDVDDVEKFRYQAGQLTWLPLTFYDNDLQYVAPHSSSKR